ncbi:MAG TPA: type II toxin-antitoxin system VapC family toxin [Bacteroidota bacterium]|nr:type II toxin-antitoxin system VapC family toxin [Bacteroidota bacterium]
MNQGSVPKVVVDTDVLLDHLVHRGGAESVLRLAMQKFFCYTTVFNAIDMFSIARTEKERVAVEQALSAMKILGLNAKSAKRYGTWIARGLSLTGTDFFMAAICLDSRLPILTWQPKRFSSVKQLVIVPAAGVTKKLTGVQMLRQATRRNR